MTERFDVVVVGGGMVGATAALALALEGFQVALVEPRQPARDWPADDFDLRVSAVTRASRNIFANLGVWQDMAAQRVTPYQRMCVWERHEADGIHFDAESVGEPELGHIVENRVITHALWSRLESVPGARMLVPAKVQGLVETAEGVQLSLDDGTEVSARLVVGADGANSRIRELAGIETDGRPYDQHAVVATVEPAGGHDRTAWQRFLPTGPLALLPLGASHCSIVWSTSAEQAAMLLELDDAGFGVELTKATQSRLGAISSSGPRGRFPLQLQRATRYVKPGIALIGDAAHVIHPLAGQGVNLGLLDAAALVQELVGARQAGRGPGEWSVLRRYERARKADNLLMQYGMDGFKRLFGSALPPVRLLRGLGMRMADRNTLIKGIFAGMAQGRGTDALPLTRASESLT